MDGDQGAGPRGRPALCQINRGQPGLPVVQVQRVGPPTGESLIRDQCRSLAQGRKPLRVVGPVLAVRAQIDVARSIIEVRRIQHVDHPLAQLARHHPRRAAEHRAKVGRCGERQ